MTWNYKRVAARLVEEVEGKNVKALFD